MVRGHPDQDWLAPQGLADGRGRAIGCQAQQHVQVSVRESSQPTRNALLNLVDRDVGMIPA
jgi:hypothetical protein